MDLSEIGSRAADDAIEAGEKISSFMGEATSTVSGFLGRLGERFSAEKLDAIVNEAKNLRSMGVVSGVLIVLAILFIIRIIRKPMKLIFKLLLNTGIGLILLFAVNYFGSRYGIGVEITWLNAIVTGIFGLPGLAVLMLLRFIRVFR